MVHWFSSHRPAAQHCKARGRKCPAGQLDMEMICWRVDPKQCCIYVSGYYMATPPSFSRLSPVTTKVNLGYAFKALQSRICNLADAIQAVQSRPCHRSCAISATQCHRGRAVYPKQVQANLAYANLGKKSTYPPLNYLPTYLHTDLPTSEPRTADRPSSYRPTYLRTSYPPTYLRTTS